MQIDNEIRIKKVNNALGIAMTTGNKPSAPAMEVSKRYAAGEISAAQAKQIYLKSVGLVP